VALGASFTTFCQIISGFSDHKLWIIFLFNLFFFRFWVPIGAIREEFDVLKCN
jgi:hypothetical protein